MVLIVKYGQTIFKPFLLFHYLKYLILYQKYAYTYVYKSIDIFPIFLIEKLSLSWSYLGWNCFLAMGSMGRSSNFFLYLCSSFRLDFTASEKEVFFLEVMMAPILFSYPSVYVWSIKMFFGLWSEYLFHILFSLQDLCRSSDFLCSRIYQMRNNSAYNVVELLLSLFTFALIFLVGGGHVLVDGW